MTNTEAARKAMSEVLAAVNQLAYPRATIEAIILAAMQEQERWIKVSEKLPEERQDVLFTAFGNVYIGFRYGRTISHGTRGGEKEWRWHGNCDLTDGDITHWRELPAPPKEG